MSHFPSSFEGVKIIITLDGEPRGKGRPRSRIVFPRDERKQPFVHIYADPKTVAYENALAWAAKAAMRSAKPLVGPLYVTVTAFMGVPPTWTRKRRDDALAGVIRPTGKPDYDNIGKVVDALNGIVWVDDSQIVDARIRKLYDERARLVIQVEEYAMPLMAVGAEDAA